MGYQKRDISQEKAYVDKMPTSCGYCLADYRPMMFYSPTEHETLAGIKYGQITVDYDLRFNEFAASLRGEMPKTYFGLIAEDNEARFAPPISEEEYIAEAALQKMRSTKASEEIRNELIEAQRIALQRGDVKRIRITEIEAEREETIVFKRKTKIKTRQIFLER